MAVKVGAVLHLDGEKQYTAAFTNAGKAVRLHKEELKGLDKEFATEANSLEALMKKHESLGKVVEELKKKQDAAYKGLESANKAYNDNLNSLNAMERELRDAQKALEDYAKAGDDSSDGYKEAAARVDAFTKNVADQALAVDRAEGKVLDWQKKVAASSNELRSANQALDKNERYLKEAESAADKCATSIDRFGNEVRDAGDDLEKTSQNASKFSTVMGGVAVGELAADGLRALAGAAKEAAAYVVEVGSNFEAAMSKVSALSGATDAELSKMSEAAQKLGATTRFSATEVADGFSYMALAGWDTQQMLASINGVVQLAAASEMDLAEASDMVTDYLSAFGLEASKAGKMADQMAYAQAHSNTSVKQLGDAFGNSAANMHAAGQSMETTTAILEALANQGTKGAEAGTQVAAMMRDVTAKMSDGAIKIGDVSVAVADSQGNFRDMIDILADVEKATDGMGSAEKSAALQATFTARSIKGVNQVLNEGTDQIQSYKDQLQQCDGAAESMASEMQNNLSGALTEFNSATEGLGITVFNAISGPLTYAVETATDVIGGLNEALQGSGDQASQTASEVITARDELEKAMQAASDNRTDYEDQAREIDILVEQLFNLDAAEEKSEGQKLRLQAAAERLAEIVPELSGLYDEQTGSLTLTREEVENLTEAYKRQQVEERILANQKDLLDAQTDAGIALEKAKGQLENLKATQELFAQIKENAQEAILQFDQDAFDGSAYYAEQMALLDEALKTGLITMEQYDSFLKYISTDAGQLGNAVEQATNAVSEYSTSTLEAEVQSLSASYEDCSAALDENAEAGERYLASLAPQAEATGEAADAAGDMADAAGESASASQDAADAAEDYADAAGDAADADEERAKAAEAAAARMKKAYESAADAVEKAWNDAVTAARNGIDVDITAEWDGGMNESVETLLQRAQKNVEALQQYEANLQAVSEHVGKEIAPEFLSYLEGLGKDGANTLQQIADAFQKDGGPEQVKAWSDKYVEALAVQDRIAAQVAADEIALKGLLGELGGSLQEEFANLSETISAAMSGENIEWNAMSEDLADALQDSVTVARTIGIKIPEGLGEGIADGTIGPQQAADELAAAISGHLDTLREIAEKQGVQIPADLAEGIKAGGADTIEAYNAILGLLSESAAEVEGQAAEQGAKVSESYGKGLSDKSDEAESGASELTGAATGALSEGENTFQSEGETAGSAYATGLGNKATEIQNAAYALGRDGAEAIKRSSPYYESAGLAMAEGIANGIYFGRSRVTAAMQNVALAALQAAKETLDIHSPSRKFRDEVGQQISAGMAYGIEDKASLAGDQASEMSRMVLESATAWLDEYKKRQTVSLADEEWYWQQVVAHCKTGTAAYAQVIRNARQAEGAQLVRDTSLTSEDAYGIANNFNVSRYNVSGSGKDRKEELKDTEDYYSEILSAAKKHQSNMSLLHTYSLKEELDYWTQVQNHMKRGTQAWYDALKEVQGVEKKIRDAAEKAQDEEVKAAEERAKKIAQARAQIISDAETTIRHQQIENNAEMSDWDQYVIWQKALRQLTEGTEEWYDALEHVNELTNRMAEDAEKEAEEEKKRHEESIANIKKRREEEEQARVEAVRAAEQKRQAIISDTETKIRHIQIETNREMSASSQLYYWQEALKKLSKGTEEWYSALEKINALQRKVADETAAKLEAQERRRQELEEQAAKREEARQKAREERERAAIAARTKLIDDAATEISHHGILYGEDMSLEKQLEIWQGVLSNLRVYTDEWWKVKDTVNKIRKQMAADAAKQADEQKAAAEKAAEAERKAAEDAAKAAQAWKDAIVSRTKTEIEQYEILNNSGMSPEAQLAKWMAALKQTTAYTDAWYDILAEINSIRNEIAAAEAEAAEEAKKRREEERQATASAQERILSEYKNFYDVSNRAEMQYWAQAAERWSWGSDEWYEANKNMVAARKAYYEERKKLDDDYAKSVQAVQDKLADQVEDLTKTYEDAVAAREKSIYASQRLFERWDPEGYNAETLLDNLRTQVEGMAFWEKQLEELAGRGISEDLLSELREMGPSAAASIWSLNQMSEEALEEYERLYAQKRELAHSQAVKDNEKLRNETNAQLRQARGDAAAEYAALTEDYKEAVRKAETDLDPVLEGLLGKAEEIGENIAYAIYKTFSANETTFGSYNSMVRISDEIIAGAESIPEDLAVIGKEGLDGLLAAMTDADAISAAGADLSDRLVEEMLAVQERLAEEMQVIGRTAASMNFSALGAINDALADGVTGPQIAVKMDDAGIIAVVSQVLAAVNRLAGQQVVLDTGALVGELSDGISKRQADQYLMYAGGRL